MAVMTTGDRATVNSDLMRDLSLVLESCATLKPDLRAAVDAADQWASDNAASFNTALPVAARTTLTAPQKARLLMRVIRQRWLVGV